MTKSYEMRPSFNQLEPLFKIYKVLDMYKQKNTLDKFTIKQIGTLHESLF